MREVVCNTSPVQYLYQAEGLEVLPALYTHVVVPAAVAGELQEGRARGVALPDVGALPWLEARAVRDRRLLPLVTDLGAGAHRAHAAAGRRPRALGAGRRSLRQQFRQRN